MPHRYKITVQPLDEDGSAEDTAPLTFTVTNHDDLLEIASKTRAIQAVPGDEALEFAIGLKLFSEVLIRHRKAPLFENLWPHFGDFMKQLKSHKPTRRDGN